MNMAPYSHQARKTHPFHSYDSWQTVEAQRRRENENKRSRRTCSELRISNDAKRSKISELRDELRLSEAKFERLKHDYDGAYDALRIKSESEERLKSQIIGLKKTISSQGHLEGQISDDILNRHTTQLSYEIQNWAASNLRKVRMRDNLGDLPQDAKEVLANAVPFCKPLFKDAVPKLPLCQAIVASHLMRIFNAPQLIKSDLLEHLGDFFSHIATTTKPSKFSQWRSQTNMLIYNMSDEELESITNTATVSTVKEITDLISQVFDTSVAESGRQALQKIIINAFKLSRTIRVQEASYKFRLPSSGTFNPRCMDDNFGQDEPEMEGKPIICALFPMLVKHDDGAGGLKTVISKARVFCAQD